MNALPPLVLGLSLVLSACGGGAPESTTQSTTPPVTTQPGTPTQPGTSVSGPALPAPLSTAALDKAALTTLGNATSTQVLETVKLLATTSGFGSISLLPLSVRPSSAHPGLVAQAADSCKPAAAPDTTDGDRDGVYRDATQTQDCTGTENGFALHTTGAWHVTDKNDADAKSGFTYRLDNASTLQGTAHGTTLDLGVTTSTSLAVDPRAGGGLGAQLTMVYGAKGTSISGSGHVDADWQLALNLVTSPDPGGVNVAFSGSSSTDGLSSGPSVGPAGSLSVSGTLHYAPTCHGVNGGSVTYTSGPATLTYTYTGCNTAPTVQ